MALKDHPTLTLALRTAAGLVGVAAAGAAAVAGYRAHVRSSCKEFYERSTREFKLPGLGTGFDPQDVLYDEGSDQWLVSGYLGDRSWKGHCPVYKRTTHGQWVSLQVRRPDGTIDSGHGAGIAVAGPWAFLTTRTGALAFSAEALASAENGDVIDGDGYLNLFLMPAFLGVWDDALWVGEYHCPVLYETPDSHHLTCPDGTENPALALRFPLDTSAPYGVSAQPDLALSIPGAIQGMCAGRQGGLVLSQAAGIDEGHLLSYGAACLEPEGTILVAGTEVPLGFLDGRTLVDRLRMPPMGEGICRRAGRVWLANESCAGRYQVGRLFDGRYVRAVDI